MVREQIKAIEQARLERLEQAPQTGPNAMVRLLASVIGVGIETADMLVQEVLSRNLRDRRAVARYAGLTGSPDESGSKRREKGLAKIGQCPGAPRPDPTRLALPAVPEGQRSGAVVPSRTEGAKGARKTTMIVALARKLLIALWRMVTTGEVPQGVVLRQRPDRASKITSEQHRVSARQAATSPGWPITIRGGGDPSQNMVIEPSVRMGPPPRSLAAEANDCFMVRPRTGPTEYKVAARCLRAPWRAPLGSFPHRFYRPRSCGFDGQRCALTTASTATALLLSSRPRLILLRE